MTHLVVAKFKEGVVMGDIKKGVEKMASQIDCIKSFEWFLFLPFNLISLFLFCFLFFFHLT